MALQIDLTAKKSAITATIGASVVAVVVWFVNLLIEPDPVIPGAVLVGAAWLITAFARWAEQWKKHRG